MKVVVVSLMLSLDFQLHYVALPSLLKLPRSCLCWALPGFQVHLLAEARNDNLTTELQNA